MPNKISTLGRRKEAKGDRHQLADVLERARPSGTDERFQLREGQFDRIEVGTIGRQEADLRANRLNRRSDRWLFMDGQVVEDDDVAAAQRRDQDLLHVGEKRHVVDWAVEDASGLQPVETQGRDDRVRVPMTAGRVITQPRAEETASVPTEEIRRHATFIQKHILADVTQRLPRLPMPPCRDDIRPTLFVGVYRFF